VERLHCWLSKNIVGFSYIQSAGAIDTVRFCFHAVGFLEMD
jgi:hypothetical protein